MNKNIYCVIALALKTKIVSLVQFIAKVFLRSHLMDFYGKRDFGTSVCRSKRDKIICIRPWNVKKFFKLLDKLEVFFAKDRFCRLADNYLIAMVLTYFLRADFEPEEYTTKNFFAALLLAYNMEEDEVELMLLELHEHFRLECAFSLVELKRLRNDLFRRVDYRAAVSRACCDIVMRYAKPNHDIWNRRRRYSR